MNKLDVSSPTFALSPASQLSPNPGRRLIVLFPASEADTPDLVHRIWEIARSLQLNVLLFSLSNDLSEEAQLRRKLITMAAIIKDPSVSTDIMIEHGSDWVMTLPAFCISNRRISYSVGVREISVSSTATMLAVMVLVEAFAIWVLTWKSLRGPYLSPKTRGCCFIHLS